LKKFKSKNAKFHTYKSKQERSFRVVLKYIHASTNLDDIKKEIKVLGHIVTNIWNIKKQDTKKALHMFYVERKPKNNNKNIYNVSSLLQCRVQFKPPHLKHEIPQCIVASGTAIQKLFAFVKRDALNAQKTNQLLTARAGRNLRTSNAYCEGNHQLLRLYGL
jgi:hypothetical protein